MRGLLGVSILCFGLSVGIAGEPPPSQILSAGADGFQRFGSSVAVDGRTLVIGAEDTGQRVTGAAYVYRRDGVGWVFEQSLQPPVPLPTFGYFGHSVSVSGDTIVIGVGNESEGPRQSYIYVHETNGWRFQQAVPFSGQVAIDGDTVIVGDYGATYGTYPFEKGEAGAATIFVRSNGLWTAQQRIYATDPQRAGYFGMAVDIQGNTAVVGAIGDLSSGDESGAAYVFTRTGTNWTQTQKLRAGDPQRAADFGRSLSLSEDLLVVGAPGYCDVNVPGSYTNAGAAYIFARMGTNWLQQQKLVSLQPTSNDGFGFAVSCNDRGQVFVTQLDVYGYEFFNAPSGAVTLFQRIDGTWRPQGRLAPNAGRRGDQFGGSAATTGNVLVVGDPNFLGSVYVYEGVVFHRWQRTGAHLNLIFDTVPRATFTIEYSETLPNSGAWQSLTNISGEASTVTVPINLLSRQRFYRVRMN